MYALLGFRISSINVSDNGVIVTLFDKITRQVLLFDRAISHWIHIPSIKIAPLLRVFTVRSIYYVTT